EAVGGAVAPADDDGADRVESRVGVRAKPDRVRRSLRDLGRAADRDRGGHVVHGHLQETGGRGGVAVGYFRGRGGDREDEGRVIRDGDRQAREVGRGQVPD